MTAFDTWQEKGFDAIAQDYLSRFKLEAGTSQSIAANGDLMVRRRAAADIERHELVSALAAPSWLDPKTGGPR
jgi:hypothetical protein